MASETKRTSSYRDGIPSWYYTTDRTSICIFVIPCAGETYYRRCHTILHPVSSSPQLWLPAFSIEPVGLPTYEDLISRHIANKRNTLAARNVPCFLVIMLYYNQLHSLPQNQ